MNIKYLFSLLYSIGQKKLQISEPGMKAYPSYTNITWLKHDIHDTDSNGVSGYVQYIKICEVFLDKLLCTIKISCNVQHAFDISNHTSC